MSEAMRLIVNGYVKLRARKELDDLKADRCRMATELKSRHGSVFDLSSPIRQLEEEIEVVEQGLARLAGER